MFTITLNTEGFETLKYEIKKELASELKDILSSQAEVLTRSEAAQFLKISKPTLDKLVAKEVVPFMILGDQKRFIKSDLLNIGRSGAL